jgi:hypothetical protein
MKQNINEISKLKRLAGIITENEYQESIETEGKADYSKVDSILNGTYKKPEEKKDPEIQKMADILDKLVSKPFDHERLEDILNALGPIKPKNLDKVIDIMKNGGGFDLNGGDPFYNLEVNFKNYSDDSKGIALSWSNNKKWEAG